MRLIRLLIALLFLAAGLVIGALNAQPVALDLGVTTLRATLGVCVLVSVLLGAIAAGVVLVASVVLPLRQRLYRATRSNAATPQPGDRGER